MRYEFDLATGDISEHPDLPPLPPEPVTVESYRAAIVARCSMPRRRNADTMGPFRSQPMSTARIRSGQRKRLPLLLGEMLFGRTLTPSWQRLGLASARSLPWTNS